MEPKSERYGMRPETISVITKLINSETNSRKQHMLNCINMQLDQSIINDIIESYQEMYIAQQDFIGWLEEREEDNG